MLTLTFLGTSAGMPTKQRNVTALAVSLDNPHIKTKQSPWLLVDCGEATQHQLLRTPLSLLQLQAICITHVHGDHCYGLPGLLSSMAMSGRKTPLTIIAPQAIQDFLTSVTHATQLHCPFTIHFIAIETVLAQSRTTNDSICLQIDAQQQVLIDITLLSHRTPSYAFRIKQVITYDQLDTQRLTALGIAPGKAWGSLQQGYDVKLDDGKTLLSDEFVCEQTDTTSIIVGGDNDTPELLLPLMDGVTLLVHEATYTQAIADKIRSRPAGFDPKHSTAKQVAQFAQSVNLPYLILTHFSARFQLFDDPDSRTFNMGHIRQEVNQYYQGVYWLAQDFARFSVDQAEVKMLD